MILGIYSDLHANLPAMEAMFAATKGRVDTWLCAGDSVGLFPYVNEVLDLQREYGVHAVFGDHEQLLLSGEPMTHSFVGNQALGAQREAITAMNRNYLTGLKEHADLELDGLRIRINHVLATTAQKYSFNQAQLDTDYAGYDFVLFGHTHLGTVLYGREVIALNPGSAGFPVDAAKRPSILLLDTQSRDFEFLRFDMDVARLKRDIQHANYNPKLLHYLDNNFRWI